MPSSSHKIAVEGRKLRRLIAEYLHHRQSDRSRLAAEINAILVYLDKNALAVGDSKDAVEDLLGPAPGNIGADVWFYPSDVSSKAYEITFHAGQVVKKGFETVRFN